MCGWRPARSQRSGTDTCIEPIDFQAPRRMPHGQHTWWQGPPIAAHTEYMLQQRRFSTDRHAPTASPQTDTDLRRAEVVLFTDCCSQPSQIASPVSLESDERMKKLSEIRKRTVVLLRKKAADIAPNESGTKTLEPCRRQPMAYLPCRR